ncbi:MAG TPA: hypothetical protein VLF14_07640 [Candidatus Binatia bacterium]|nr:hypothetical protein [Candidatus Binatia bacterium]
MIENEVQERRGNGESTEEAARLPRAEQLQDLAGQIDSWLRTFVRERPFTTVAAAVATGFVLARLLRR